MVIRYGYDDSPVIPQLGRVVYDEVRRYIITSGATVVPQGEDINTAIGAIHEGESEKKVGDSSGIATPTATLAGTTSPAKSTARRLESLDQAYRSQVLFIVGKLQLRYPEHAKYNLVKRVLLMAFLWMRESTMEKVTSMKVSMDKLVECGFIREI